MTYNCVLYDFEGNLFKPIEIDFDPHMRVGFFVFDNDFKDVLTKLKKVLCKCSDSDGCYIERILYINSISFKSNLGTFSYKNIDLDISNIPFLYDLKSFPKRLSVIKVLREIEKIAKQNSTFSEYLHTLNLSDTYPIILLISIYMSLYEENKNVDILKLCFLLKEFIYSSS